MYFYNRQVGVIVHIYMHNTHRHVSIHTPRRGSGSVSGLKVVYGENPKSLLKNCARLHAKQSETIMIGTHTAMWWEHAGAMLFVGGNTGCTPTYALHRRGSTVSGG